MRRPIIILFALDMGLNSLGLSRHGWIYFALALAFFAVAAVLLSQRQVRN